MGVRTGNFQQNPIHKCVAIFSPPARPFVRPLIVHHSGCRHSVNFPSQLLDIAARSANKMFVSGFLFWYQGQWPVEKLRKWPLKLFRSVKWRRGRGGGGSLGGVVRHCVVASERSENAIIYSLNFKVCSKLKMHILESVECRMVQTSENSFKISTTTQFLWSFESTRDYSYANFLFFINFCLHLQHRR